MNTVQGENWISRTAKLASEIAFWASPKLRVTRLRGRVVELVVLEVGEAEGQGFFEDERVDLVAELGPQQGLAGRDAALGGRQGGDDERLESHEPVDPLEGLAPARGRELERRHDAVDDELADPGDQGGQGAGDERQGAEKHGQPAIGFPDQAKRPRRVYEQIARTPGGSGRDGARRAAVKARQAA
jgi:hypothetical protein